jgi:hypothetical protein
MKGGMWLGVAKIVRYQRVRKEKAAQKIKR